MLRALFLSIAACALTSCATSYEPRSPRVAVVRGQWNRALVKDGVSYPGGLFGGRVDEAVRGVPEAERHTSAYATLSTAGSLTIIGAEALGASASVVSATASRGEARTDAEIGLVVGSAVAFVTGIVLHFMAEPHLYDAANIYNDEMDRRRAGAGPGARQLPLTPTGQRASDTPSSSPCRRVDE